MHAILTDAHQNHIMGIVPVQNNRLANIPKVFERGRPEGFDLHTFLDEKVAHLAHREAFTTGFGNQAKV